MRFEYWMGKNGKWHLYAVAGNGRVVFDEGLEFECIEKVFEEIETIKSTTLNATVINITPNEIGCSSITE